MTRRYIYYLKEEQVAPKLYSQLYRWDKRRWEGCTLPIFKGFNKIHSTPYSLLGLTLLLSYVQLEGGQGRSLGNPHLHTGTPNPVWTFQTI